MCPDCGGGVHPDPGASVGGTFSTEGGMSNVDPAARGADPLRHGPDPQLQKAARGKSPRWRSYSSVSLVVRHIQKLTDTRRCQTQDELHSSVINVDETGCGFLRAFR